MWQFRDREGAPVDISDTLLIHLKYMSTIKTRINISLSDELKEALRKLAKRDNIPEATKAARLLEVALELEEDQAWNEIAEKRDAKKTQFVSHIKAWKK